MGVSLRVGGVVLRRGPDPATRLQKRTFCRTLTGEQSQGRVRFMDYKQRITIEPDKRSGQPCIRGLRITVQDVQEYLASGMSADEILKDFPDLTAEDIRACLAFADLER